MFLNIPSVGCRFSIKNSHDVSLKNTGQNKIFISKVCEQRGVECPHNTYLDVTLPKGLVIEVDRVYVRKGDGADFNSVTFKITSLDNKGLPKGRFFLPLSSVNNIELLPEKENVRKTPLRKILSKQWGALSIEERLRDGMSHGFLLSERISNSKPLWEGQLCVDFFLWQTILGSLWKKECEKLEVLSIEELEDDIIGMYDHETYEIIKSRLHDTPEALVNKKREPVFKIAIFLVEGEKVVELTPLGEMASRCIGDLVSMIKAYRCAIYSRIKNQLRTPPFRSVMDEFVLQHGDDWSWRFGGDRKNNKQPLVDETSGKGFVLNDGLSSCTFFHSKNSASLGVSFLDSEKGWHDIKGFRKIFRDVG